MELPKGHPSHERPSISQDYRYPPPSTHHFSPGPSPSFHHAYTASLIAAGHPEQHQLSQPPMLQQRDVVTRLPPRIDDRSGYQQPDSLAVIPGNVDPMDQQRPDAFKKQTLTTNPYFYHPNFAVMPSVAAENNHLLQAPPKECPPNLVIGSAVAMDAAPRENSHVVSTMDMASSTSSPSTCTSLQPLNNPEASVERTTAADPVAPKDAVIAGSVTKELTEEEKYQMLRKKFAPKPNSLIQTLLKKGGPPPDGLSYDQFTDDANDVRVIAVKPIEPGQVYGPLKGSVKTLDCLHNVQAWELCLDGMVAAYMAPAPRKEWMGFVRNARYNEECNLDAGQVYGRIYFTVIKRIQPGTELRVFYSDTYRENCGFMYDLSALNYNKDTESFSCTMCNVKTVNSKSMVRHYKVTHPDDGLQEEKSVPLKVAERLKLLNAQCKLPPQYDEDDDEEEEEETKEDDARAAEKNSEEEAPKTSVQGMAASMTNLQRDQSNHNAKRKMQDNGDSQRFICPTCGKNFPTHGRLVVHESFHTTNDAKDNDTENETDDDDDSVTEYIDHGNGIQCPICGFTFKDVDKFKVHKKKHKTHRYMCDQCGNLYTRRTYMYRHQRENHGAVHVRARRTVNVFMQGTYTSAKAPQGRAGLLSSGDESTKNVPNRCKICHYVTISNHMLREHLMQHQNRPYGCEKCGRVYMSRGKLYDHLRRKHGATKIHYLTPQRRQRIMKYLKEMTVQVLRCGECGFSCRDRKSLEVHKQSHKLVQKVVRKVSTPADLTNAETCEICGFKTADEEFFTEHINKHVAFPFGCKKCGNTYTTKKSLIRHHHEKHEEQILDNRELDQSLDLKARLIHSKHKDACPECAFYTPHKSVLKKHIARHKEFPYGCIECGNVYTRNSTLRRHQRSKHIHLFTGGFEGPEKEIGGLLRKMTSPEELQIQGVSCPHCGFRTPDKNFLTDHVLLHLTHPCGCRICGNVYTQKKFVMRHMQEKHPEAYREDVDVAPVTGDQDSASDSGGERDGSLDDDRSSESGKDDGWELEEMVNDDYGRDDEMDGEGGIDEDEREEKMEDGEEDEEMEGEDYSDESDASEYDDDEDEANIGNQVDP